MAAAVYSTHDIFEILTVESAFLKYFFLLTDIYRILYTDSPSELTISV